jgi:hypothetical protein
MTCFPVKQRRRAGGQSRKGRRRQDRRQAQPVHPAPGATKTVNRALEAKARALAGLKGYATNLQVCPDSSPVTAQFVIGAYHRLYLIEKAFRMSKHDLQARPIYHHKRESIEAHLAIVFAALAVSHWIETETGWSIKNEPSRAEQILAQGQVPRVFKHGAAAETTGSGRLGTPVFCQALISNSSYAGNDIRDWR